ncbi:MAG: hypothetical protein NZ108_08635, partial [Bacteroidia bacterium]|nr:hypothetical protein [Bacteroidia bacterium]
MKFIRQSITSLLASLVLLTGCKYKFPEEPVQPAPQPGSADFSRYVSLGNSLTAGFADGALSEETQKSSYPAILALQFKTVGGGEFSVPIISGPNGFGGVSNGQPYGKLFLELTCDRASFNFKRTPGDNPAPYTGPINNFGVPGVKVGDVLNPDIGNPSAPNYNLFYGRIAKNPGTSTIVSDAKSVNPTFFTVWLGNNDILAWAASGGTAGTLTSSTTFATQLNAVLDSMLSVSPNTKGAVANIPDVTAIPYFQAVTAGLISARAIPFT